MGSSWTFERMFALAFFVAMGPLAFAAQPPQVEREFASPAAQILRRDPEALSGGWRLVAKVPVTSSGAWFESASDPEGVRNRDGSRGGLRFIHAEDGLRAALRTQDPRALDGGPFPADLDPNTGTVRFSAYAYDHSTQLGRRVEDSHFEYRCRVWSQGQGAASALVCELRFMADIPSQLPPSSRAMHGQVIGYYRYLREDF